MKPTALDFILGWLASIVALISTGIALKNNSAALFFAVLVTIAYACAYSFRSLSRKVLDRYTSDGIALFLVTLFCIFASQSLNQIIPEGGFAPNLVYTVALCWMLVLGGIVAWSDGTIMFLVVPSIALFGLVGAFDTFAYAPAMFFVFMLASATLFARSHLRASAIRAERVHDRAHITLSRYEWSAVAGPEWALASAMIIIAFSAVGAPVIQRSVQGFTNPIKLNASSLPRQDAGQADLSSVGNQDRIRVGEGPIGRPSEAKVFTVRMDTPALLRGRTYAVLNNRQWMPVNDSATILQPSLGKFDIQKFLKPTRNLQKYGVQTFSINFDRPGLNLVFSPGELSFVNMNRDAASLNYDGTVGILPAFSASESISGEALTPSYEGIEKAYSVVPVWIPAAARSVYTDFGPDNPQIKAFAEQAIKGANSDYERAEKLRIAISKTITYNLQAERVPDNKDPVVAALFESKQGYCDIFATSFTVCARTVGLVSRVAVGYLVDPSESISGDTFQVRDQHYHMWSEVYFEGHGWIPFDATEGATSIEGNGRGSAWKEQKRLIDDPPVRIAILALVGVGLVLAGIKYGKILFAWIQWQRSLNHPSGFVPSPEQIALNSSVAKSLKRIERISKIPRAFGDTPREYLQLVDTQYNTELSSSAYLTKMEIALYSSNKDVLAKEISVLGSVALEQVRQAIKDRKK